MQVTPALPWATGQGGTIQLSTPVTLEQLVAGALAFTVIEDDGAEPTTAEVYTTETGIFVGDTKACYQITSFEGSTDLLTLTAVDNIVSLVSVVVQSKKDYLKLAYDTMWEQASENGKWAIVLSGYAKNETDYKEDFLISQDGSNIIGGDLIEDLEFATESVRVLNNGVLSIGSVLNTVPINSDLDIVKVHFNELGWLVVEDEGWQTVESINWDGKGVVILDSNGDAANAVQQTAAPIYCPSY